MRFVPNEDLVQPTHLSLGTRHWPLVICRVLHGAGFLAKAVGFPRCREDARRVQSSSMTSDECPMPSDKCFAAWNFRATFPTLDLALAINSRHRRPSVYPAWTC